MEGDSDLFYALLKLQLVFLQHKEGFRYPQNPPLASPVIIQETKANRAINRKLQSGSQISSLLPVVSGNRDQVCQLQKIKVTLVSSARTSTRTVWQIISIQTRSNRSLGECVRSVCQAYKQQLRGKGGCDVDKYDCGIF